MADAASEGPHRAAAPQKDAASTLLLGALTAAAPFAMDSYLASLPSMTHALSASTAEVQLTLSVYMYGWGIAQLFAGPLSDRFGRRPALLWGLGVFVVASIACALARDVHMLIAGRLVQAVSMASIAVVPRAIVRDLYSGDKAAHILSVMAIVLGIAPIVAPLIGSNLHVAFGWRSNFVLAAVYAVVLAYFAYTTLPETLATRDARATAPRAMLANFHRLLRAPDYVRFMLVASFAYSGLFAFLAGSAFVFVSVMGQGERGFGLMFGIVMLGNVTGAVIGSRLVRRIGIARQVRLGTSLMLAAGVTLGGLALLDVRHPAAVIVPMFAYMLTFQLTMPPAIAGALTPFLQIAGSASSLLAFCQFLVASTAALVVGLTLDGTTRPMALTIATASVLAFASLRATARVRR